MSKLDKSNEEESGIGEWQQIRSKYASSPRDDDFTPDTEVHNHATDQLLSDMDILTAEDSDTIYRYDPETGIYKPDGEARIREHLKEKLGPQFRKSRVKEILYGVESDTFVKADKLGGDKDFLCVKNGVIYLRAAFETGMISHSSSYQFLSALPVEFDPDSDCPRFKGFLNEVVPIDGKEKLQEYVGYCLMHWTQKHKKALLLTGPTDSGKSTFLNVIGKLLGPQDNVAAESLKDLSDSRWGKAQLYGKFANISPDLSRTAIESPGEFKILTGNDSLVSAEFKHGQKFQFTPTTKLLFSANQLPDIKGADDAFHKRFLHVRFPNSIPDSDQDERLEEKLTEELSGILNWAIEGYQRLEEQGEFTNERSIEEKREYWNSYGDSVRRFRYRFLEITGREDDYVPKQEVYDWYSTFCQKEGFTPVPYDDGTFTRELQDLKPIETAKPTIDGTRTHCYVGCELKQEAVEDLEGNS